MAKKQAVANVLVTREWWNTAISLISKATPATTEHMCVRGPLIGEDLQGIWIGDVPTNVVHAKDTSRKVMMKFLIPWRQIIAIGIIDDPGSMKLGFTAETLREEAEKDL